MRIVPVFWMVLLTVLSACGSPDANTESAAPEATATPADPAERTPPADEKVILFFGNSLTAGYGLSPEEAFPSLVQAKIDSLGLPYRIVNAGLSGETTATGRNRLPWMLKQKVDILIIELGANDGLRGIDTEETRRNLQAMIDEARSTYPRIKIILTGMLVPPNMGPDYEQKFEVIFPELAANNQTALVPFLLNGVAGDPALNLPDGIHPTAIGHGIVANNVWETLLPLLDKRS